MARVLVGPPQLLPFNCFIHPPTWTPLRIMVVARVALIRSGEILGGGCPPGSHNSWDCHRFSGRFSLQILTRLGA